MPKIEVPVWTRQRSLDSDHYPRCTHRADNCVLLKDAEQVAVFWSPARNVVHISVHLTSTDGPGWFVCKVLTADQYEVMESADEMRLIQTQLNKLKSLV